MVILSCLAYGANRLANALFGTRSNSLTSTFGAFVLSLGGNILARAGGATAFTIMVTGVLFLVPVSLTDS